MMHIGRKSPKNCPKTITIFTPARTQGNFKLSNRMANEIGRCFLIDFNTIGIYSPF